MNTGLVIKVAGLVCSAAGLILTGISSSKETEKHIEKEVAKHLGKK